MLWDLVDAILRGLPCSVVYTEYRRAPWIIQFNPTEFQVGAVLRIKGVQGRGGEEIILIVQHIRSARVIQASPGTKPSGKGHAASIFDAQR